MHRAKHLRWIIQMMLSQTYYLHNITISFVLHQGCHDCRDFRQPLFACLLISTYYMLNKNPCHSFSLKFLLCVLQNLWTLDRLLVWNFLSYITIETQLLPTSSDGIGRLLVVLTNTNLQTTYK